MAVPLPMVGREGRHRYRLPPPPRVGVEALAPRHVAVLFAYIEHGSYKAVAEHLGISRSTVKNHVTEILTRLDCASSAQACVIFDRWIRGQQPTWPSVNRRSGRDRRNGTDRRQESFIPGAI